MSVKDFKLVLLFSAMSIVFGLSWTVVLYFFKVGAFDLVYKGGIIVAMVYSAIMLYYFKKSRVEYLFSHAMVMSMILNFFFSFFVALTMFIMLDMHEQSFLSISIDVKIDEMLQNKEVYLKTISQENLDLTIESLKLTTPFTTALDFFTKFSIVGLFYSLILSLIFKKKNETRN